MKNDACNPCVQFFCRGESLHDCVEAAPAAPAAVPVSWSLLTDPPLQLCLLPEVAQLGCLPRRETAQLARSPGRKQKHRVKASFTPLPTVTNSASAVDNVTARSAFETSGLVMVASLIKLPTASLYGQPPLGSSSSLGPTSTPGVAGMSDDEFTLKRFNMLSVNAFCVTSNVPRSQSRSIAHPVYHVSV